MTSQPSVRLWPGVVAVLVQWLCWFVAPALGIGDGLTGLIGAGIGTLAVLIWWLFFSRTRWFERVGAIAVMIAAVVATFPFLDKSIQGGMMGLMFRIFVIPNLCLALVAGAAAGRRRSVAARFALTTVAIVIGCAVWTLLRTDGIREGQPQLAWRWTPTAEDRLLAQAKSIEEPPAPPAATAPPSIPAPTAPVAKKDPEWPGFRGARRDGIVRGARVDTNWSASRPVELWRRAIGPGWSSFAVDGDLLYTQEQRGEEELVSCYRVSTGKPVWKHRDATRFWESNAGPGPRGTPTLSNGRVYTFGATGILNVLDAATGAVIWSRNAAADAKKQLPIWGFSSSPLVDDERVVVAASGKLMAYDIATGKPLWSGPNHGGSYSSPHRATIDGVAQILLISADGTTSVAPADGTVLWEHTWGEGTPIVQPAFTAEGDILINAIAATGGLGIRRLSVKRDAGGWKIDERWTSTGLKPYFNDFVVHKGHAYGFDGSILSCIDLADGSRKWKGGRYGEGQLMLLPDQDALLVLSEDGELALVSASSDKFNEIARIPAIEGKTWNHPVLIGDVLLVRNGEEMAAFRLATAR
jgi:outer membrane protein assembly factor BamB